MQSSRPLLSSFVRLLLLVALQVSMIGPPVVAADESSNDDTERGLLSEVSDEIVVLATRSEKRALEAYIADRRARVKRMEVGGEGTEEERL